RAGGDGRGGARQGRRRRHPAGGGSPGGRHGSRASGHPGRARPVPVEPPQGGGLPERELQDAPEQDARVRHQRFRRDLTSSTASSTLRFAVPNESRTLPSTCSASPSASSSGSLVHSPTLSLTLPFSCSALPAASSLLIICDSLWGDECPVRGDQAGCVPSLI